MTNHQSGKPTPLTVGPDYDPSVPNAPYSEEEIERLADEAERGYDLEDSTLVYRRPGRPSLSGDAEASPQLRVRVPEELRQRAVTRAARDGTSVSEITRRALERYLVG